MQECKSIYVTQLALRNFRCFESYSVNLDAPVVLINGLNGSGKTSVLEALYYAGYLRSFRTASPRELIRSGSDGFFARLSVKSSFDTTTTDHNLQIGYAQGIRSVKIDQQTIRSHRELLNHYQVVAITQDDVELIRGAPELRRSFIDHLIVLRDESYLSLLRDLRTIIDNRNASLKIGSKNHEVLQVLSAQLWNISGTIQRKRKEMIAHLFNQAQSLNEEFCQGDIKLTIEYVPRRSCEEECDSDQMHSLIAQEYRLQRSMFGAHLDDITIELYDRSSRTYASRGQQKFLVVLFKIAFARLIPQTVPLFLIDDFMTDFDPQRSSILISALSHLKSQLIFTDPGSDSVLARVLKNHSCLSVSLT